MSHNRGPTSLPDVLTVVGACGVDGLLERGHEVRPATSPWRTARTPTPARCAAGWPGRRPPGSPRGPAFLPVDQKGRLGKQPLGPDGCRLAITRAAERAGLDL